MEDIKFERLGKGKHNRDLFDCGVDELNLFISSVANQQQKRGLNSVYVAVKEHDVIPKKIFGFYTLSANTLLFENLPCNFAKKMPKNYPVPTIKIGRLAKDKLAPKGFGNIILGVALRHVLQISKEVGIVGIDVDAKNEQVKDFYLKFGFIPLKNQNLSLFLPMTTIANGLV